MCLRNFGGAEGSFVFSDSESEVVVLGFSEACGVDSSLARFLLARFKVDCVSVSAGRGTLVVVVRFAMVLTVGVVD
jgi:hypothetical protein